MNQTAPEEAKLSTHLTTEDPSTPCHSERSEESKELDMALRLASQILRFAQNDKKDCGEKPDLE